MSLPRREAVLECRVCRRQKRQIRDLRGGSSGVTRGGGTTASRLASSAPFFGGAVGAEGGVGSAFGIPGLMITICGGSGVCTGGTMKAVAATIACAERDMCQRRRRTTCRTVAHFR